MNVVAALALAVKGALVAGIASLALVGPTVADYQPQPRNVQPPATLNVVGVNDATCGQMGGRFVGHEVCKDVDY